MPEFLPSYSPNRNRIERVGKFVKKACLASHYFANFAAFPAGITTCIHDLGTKHQAAMTTLMTRNFQMFDDQTVSPT
jgi:hypothetical protein